MNWIRILLAALAAFVAYFVFGAVAFTLPGMKAEYSRFPAVYRQAADIQRVFPIGMAATLVALLVLAVIYAKGYEGGNGVGEGSASECLWEFSGCAPSSCTTTSTSTSICG